jgi:hypothetical protein
MAKAALKSAKLALDAQDWARAETESRKALSFDSQNYLGCGPFHKKAI